MHNLYDFIILLVTYENFSPSTASLTCVTASVFGTQYTVSVNTDFPTFSDHHSKFRSYIFSHFFWLFNK